MKLIEYPDAEMMAMGLANIIAGELESALAGGGNATLAVPGGTTPGPVFDGLAATHLDWARVNVVLTDERWVPETSPRSNTRLLRARLLTDGAAAATLLPLYLDQPTPEEALAGISAALAPALPISVALLGMGEDMHTASIFPGADRLHDALHGEALVVPMRAPGAPEPRITLSARVLGAALNRHVIIIGGPKRVALERAQNLTPEKAPIAALLQGATVHWAEG